MGAFNGYSVLNHKGSWLNCEVSFLLYSLNLVKCSAGFTAKWFRFVACLLPMSEIWRMSNSCSALYFTFGM